MIINIDRKKNQISFITKFEIKKIGTILKREYIYSFILTSF